MPALRRRRLAAVAALALALCACGEGTNAPRVCRSKIAFTSSGDSTSEIFLMDPDGSNVGRLTPHGGRFASWSADGRTIAFIRSGGVRLIHADGTGEVEVPLPTLPDGGSVSRAALAPDASKLALEAMNGFTTYIAVVPVGGSGNLVRIEGAGPAWSPDGRRISYYGWGPQPATDVQIFTANPDGSGVTQVTNSRGKKGQTAWSADGRRIAFVGEGTIYTVNTDGSDLTVVRADAGVNYYNTLTWSPDGGTIAYSLSYSKPDWWMAFRIGAVDPDGSFSFLTSESLTASEPAWSPCLP